MVVDMSWRNDSIKQKELKVKLDREITGIVASIHEAQSSADTIEEKTLLLQNLKESVDSWMPIK